MPVIQAGALLFDLDGVLIDSTPAVERVWSGWAVERGFDPHDVVRRAHGRPSIATVRELLTDCDAEAENRVVEQREIADLGGVVPLPGAMELLTSLPAERWTIVTSCTRALAQVRLRAAGLPVPASYVTSTDVRKGKPHPEPYLKGACLLGCLPERCIVFEDAPAGVRSGKAAGARVVGLLTTSERTALRDAGADWIVADCANIRLTGCGSDGLTLQLASGE